MSEFVRVMAASELPPPGEAREADCAGRVICIANSNGQLAAMDNLCPHRGGPLGQGIVEDGKLICPWHAWAFDVKTGVAVHSPRAKVEVFEVKLSADDVLVRI